MGHGACTVGSVECETVQDETRRVSIDIQVQRRRSEFVQSEDHCLFGDSHNSHSKSNSELVCGINVCRAARH